MNSDIYNYSEIRDGIYLADLNTVQNEKFIKELGINAILTVDLYSLPITLPIEKYLLIKLIDLPNEDLLINLKLSNQFLFECCEQKLKVVVHCVAGISRSPAIVIAFLMLKYKLNFKTAYEMVKKKRNCINPNDGFIKQLELFYEMGLKLDVNNKKYRRHGLNHFYSEMKFHLSGIPKKNILNSLNEVFDKYIIRFHENPDLLQPKIIFKCKKCRMYLFNDINSLESSNEILKIQNLKECCNSIFIEPLKWMKNLINCNSEILNCKNCFTKIGTYNWNGINCSQKCFKHKDIFPSFKIDIKKVDYHLL